MPTTGDVTSVLNIDNWFITFMVQLGDVHYFILFKLGLNLRYEIFQKICIQNRIGVLLIAHHADDQVCPTII